MIARGHKKLGQGFLEKVVRASGTGPAVQLDLAAGVEGDLDIVVPLTGFQSDPVVELASLTGVTDGLAVANISFTALSKSSVTVRVRLTNPTAGSLSILVNAASATVESTGR